MDRTQAEKYIDQTYGYTNFCFLDDADALTFDARQVAILVPKRWWNNGPEYRVCEVRNGKRGRQLEVITFSEVRHANA